MDNYLLLDGKEIDRNPRPGSSLFYPDYTYQTANAGPLDIASAIGLARSAGRPDLQERIKFLSKAAESFTYDQGHLDHSVRMTGMPVRLVEALYRQIPEILRGVAGHLQSGNRRLPANILELQPLRGGGFKLLTTGGGFCYAITPGNDPRAAALVAANLAYLGIPFILRASPRDAASLPTLQALFAGGFDPSFASLLYIDAAETDFAPNHFKLVDSASAIWTFGPDQSVDPLLRFERIGSQARLDLKYLGLDQSDPQYITGALLELTPGEMLKAVQVEDQQVDHFEGKVVIRHTAGNCAAITWGPFTPETGQILYAASGYPAICTATKSVFPIDGKGWVEDLADYWLDRKTGDPLDPTTEIGYINPRHLDMLERLLEKNAACCKAHGGRRISSFQATPLVVSTQSELPDFFAQEIPAYVMAAHPCQSVDKAVALINAYTQNGPRLAVSLLNSPPDQRLPALSDLRSYAILIDKPTSSLAPVFHEGNDYTALLAKAQLLIT
jgi:acyl-CoA reductase-like NAD-dependent aldehyde dehydrogenase